MSRSQGAVGYTITQRKVELDPSEGVRFKINEEFDISVRIVHGELRVHSHAFSKNLAVVGDAANAVRLVVVDR